MASDDVIELGSSDEDPEPAPKRRKPPINAMVHIPKKLTGITITPAKSSAKSITKINPACIAKGTLGKSVTVTKVPKINVNPYSNMQKFNGKPVRADKHPPVKQNVAIPITGIPVAKSPIMYKNAVNPFNKTVNKGFAGNAKPNSINATGVNPLNMIKMIKPHTTRPVKIADNVKTIKGPLHSKNLSMLPPGITVKRTSSLQTVSGGKIRKMPSTIVKMSKPSVITTVNLDDDEPGTSSVSGPQWYMRPEDQEKLPLKTLVQPVDPIKGGPEKDETEEVKINQDTSPQSSKKKSPDKAPELTELEKQNNKEPDKSTFIEITIEDSPMKPAQKGFKVGAELAIIIEDSPVKTSVDVQPDTNCSSDDEKAVSSQTPHSKKKLEYPKEVVQMETIEIEFEPLPSEEDSANVTESERDKTATQDKANIDVKEKSKGETCPVSSKSETNENNSRTTEHEKEKTAAQDKANKDEKKIKEKSKAETDPVSSKTVKANETKSKISEHKIEKSKRVMDCSEILEIEESPMKPSETVQVSTPKKNKPLNLVKMIEIETIDLDEKEKDEFHPMYQSFINVCFQLENSDDMKKIVEKKIKSYYRQVPKDYTESEAFIDMVSSKIMAMKAGPEKMYLYIKDVVDELNLQRKLAKTQPAIKETKNEEQEKFLYGEDSEFDTKRQRQIRKLEKTLKKLHRAIQKLEEQEVDFDDEEDSVYLLTDSEDVTPSKDDKPLDKEVLLQRYKERMVRVHAKLCQLTNTKMPSEARVQIDARPGQPKGPAKRLEKWINKKVPIGTPLPFPDFHDVLRCVRDANQEDKLGWNEADIMEEARDLFTRCGKKLQRRRQENEWRLAASRIPGDIPDPAEDSTDLKRKLEENKRMAAKRETEVLNKYADRQNQLNLEAVEIGDKEAEESPVESDDEGDAEDNTSMTSKEKRKERLKRLLHEKSKKVTDEKENLSENSPGEIAKSQSEDVEMKDSNEAVISIKDNETKDDTEHKNIDPSESESGKKEPLNSDMPEKVEEPIQSNSSSKNKDDNEKQDDKVHSLSDDSNKVESDIDELHLLQKLYSENELNTSVMDSDSGTPIAISDSSSANEISSDERRNKKISSDVISIENSSYSESEEKKSYVSKDTVIEDVSTKEVIKETVDAHMEIECSNDGIDKKNNESDKQKNIKTFEDILLASSDESDDKEAHKENQTRTTTAIQITETCINLRDDNISIGETIIEESRRPDIASEEDLKAAYSDNNANTDSSSVEGMEIGPEINSEEQNVVETASIKSTDEGSITEIMSVKSTEPCEEESAVETTSIKSVETYEDGNGNGSSSIKSIDTIEDGNGNECTSIKSVESIEDANINETTSIKSVESIEDANGNETVENGNIESTSVKSVESGDYENIHESTSVKSVEAVEDENDNGPGSVESVETVKDGNVNGPASVESVEAVEDRNVKAPDSVESVDTVEDGNDNRPGSVESVETVKDGNVNGPASIESVEAVEDGNVNAPDSVEYVETVEDGNDNRPGSVTSVETVKDGNVNGPASVESVETVEDGNVNGPDSVESIETVKEVKINVTKCVKSVEIIDHYVINEKRSAKSFKTIDVAIEEIGHSKEDNYVLMDTSEINDADEETRCNNDSLPEPMDVDSNVEQT